MFSKINPIFNGFLEKNSMSVLLHMCDLNLNLSKSLKVFENFTCHPDLLLQSHDTGKVLIINIAVFFFSSDFKQR